MLQFVEDARWRVVAGNTASPRYWRPQGIECGTCLLQVTSFVSHTLRPLHDGRSRPAIIAAQLFRRERAQQFDEKQLIRRYGRSPPDPDPP